MTRWILGACHVRGSREMKGEIWFGGLKGAIVDAI
jgi:hypothetical protein